MNKNNYLIFGMILLVGTIGLVFAQTTVFIDDFTSGLGKWDGNGATSWTTDGTRYISSPNSLYSTNGVEGDIFSDNMDMSSATFINITFWFYPLGAVDGPDYDFYFCHGATCNLVGSFGATANDAWVWLNYTTSDSQYFTNDFHIKMNANLGTGETAWIDNVKIEITEEVDITYPQFSNYGRTPNYTEEGTKVFNTTVTQTNGTVWLDFDGTNYSASNIGGDVYEISKGLNEGVYYYNWGAFGSGASNLVNISETFEYYVDPPAYSQINMTLCTGYTAPAYNQINFTLGDSDACVSANCWSVIGTTLYVPSNCTYYIPSGTTGYVG